MRKIKEIEINGRSITVSELTVEEVVNQLDNAQSGLIGMMFDGRLPMTVVAASCGIVEDEFYTWHPGDIDKLLTEVETVNPHCARLCKTLAEIRAAQLAKASEALVSGLSSTASIPTPGGSGIRSFWRFLKHGRK